MRNMRILRNLLAAGVSWLFILISGFDPRLAPKEGAMISSICKSALSLLNRPKSCARCAGCASPLANLLYTESTAMPASVRRVPKYQPITRDILRCVNHSF